MKKNFFESNKLIIGLHILAWAILISLPLYFVKRWDIGNDFIWLYYINSTINGIIFYINYFFLVPKFFFDSKKYRYYLSIAALLFMFYFVSDISNQAVFNYVSYGKRPEKPGREFADRKMPGPPGPIFRIPMHPPFRQMHMFNYGFTSVFLIFFSLGLRVLERHSRIEKIQKELEKEKLNSELAFLKNQISPHFFFNTLNNIYSLISINAEDSQNAVLKLSKLMRYLLYESEPGNTKLSNEIDFMNNYIDLMKLRMSKKISLSVEFPKEYENVSIPPLLFVPFIENVFKHGISFRENSFISIIMTCETGSIIFKSVNSLATGGNLPAINSSGIGLINVTKRLALLYPGRHELTINQTENTFEVLLKIQLQA